MLSLLLDFKEKALDFLFPRRCIGCGAEGDFICPACLKLAVPIEMPFCPICGKPQKRAGMCSGCAGWKPAVSGIRSAFCFEGVAREAVHQLKYNHIKALAPVMAKLMASYLKKYPVPGEVLVPVPLHQARLRERGYNQSELIAGELSRLTGLEVSEGCLIRRRNTPSQARTANVTERRKNIAGAFESRGNSLAGKKVILIDDVATSGATLDECARVLKDSGAASVWGFTFAREI